VNRRITYELLLKVGATKDCSDLARFAETFPDGVDVPTSDEEVDALCQRLDGVDLDYGRAAAKLLSKSAKKAYVEARASAWKAYVGATAPAWKAYVGATAPAWNTYVEATAPAWNTYVEARVRAFIQAWRTDCAKET
jgi:hypothetical protein